MPAERIARIQRIAEFRLYVCTVLALACAVGTWTITTWGWPNWSQVAVFWSIHALMLLDRIEVPIGKMSIVRSEKRGGLLLSPGFTVLLTVAFATKPSTALAVAFLPSVSSLVRREDRVAWKLCFNAAQESVYIGLASVIFVSIRGMGADVLLTFAAAGLGAVVASTLNTWMVAGVVTLRGSLTLREIVRRMMWPMPLSVAFGLMAVMIATLYGEFGISAAVFLFMPLVALRLVRRAKLSLDDAREQTVTEFVRAVEAKDPYTFRHSERVATIAVELHRELGGKPGYLELRWSGGLLHDIGKVAVSAEILTKPSALTVEEFERIKMHPGLGADVVAEIDALKQLVPEIRFHHERVDGRGYPDGLSGNEIPYEARVLAVADAFEALTSDRPYRRGLTTQEALDELARTAGSHHDPTIVAALRRVIESGVVFERPESRPLRMHASQTAVGQ